MRPEGADVQREEVRGRPRGDVLQRAGGPGAVAGRGGRVVEDAARPVDAGAGHERGALGAHELPRRRRDQVGVVLQEGDVVLVEAPVLPGVDLEHAPGRPLAAYHSAAPIFRSDLGGLIAK